MGSVRSVRRCRPHSCAPTDRRPGFCPSTLGYTAQRVPGAGIRGDLAVLVCVGGPANRSYTSRDQVLHSGSLNFAAHSPDDERRNRNTVLRASNQLDRRYCSSTERRECALRPGRGPITLGEQRHKGADLRSPARRAARSSAMGGSSRARTRRFLVYLSALPFSLLFNPCAPAGKALPVLLACRRDRRWPPRHRWF